MSKSLFKYFGTMPHHLEFTQTKMIRFSQPGTFNDIFEMRPHFKGITSDSNIEANKSITAIEIESKKRYKKSDEKAQGKSFGEFKRLHNLNPGYIKAQAQTLAKSLNVSSAPVFAKHIDDFINQNLGVLCLTERQNNLSMWAHYAECHYGFVVEFDSTHPFFDQRVSSGDALRHLRPVQYVTSRPSLAISDLDEDNAASLLLSKGLDWDKEEEWRMVLPLNQAQTCTIKSPYNINLFLMPDDAFKSITFGRRMLDTHKQTILTNLNIANLSHLSIFQAAEHEAHYELVMNKVR